MIDEFVRHRLGEHARHADGFEDGRVPTRTCRCSPSIVRVADRQQDTLDPMLVGGAAADWPLRAARPGAARPAARRRRPSCGCRTARRRKVVINEYLDVAHGFFDGEEPRMANGVLDRLARQLRPAEFAATA